MRSSLRTCQRLTNNHHHALLWWWNQQEKDIDMHNYKLWRHWFDWIHEENKTEARYEVFWWEYGVNYLKSLPLTK